MEGTGDREFDRFSGAVFFGQGDSDDDFGGFARENDLARGVDVCDIHISHCGELAHAVFFATDDCRHTALRGLASFLHGAGALVHETESGFKVESPGGRVCGEFPKREAGGGLKIEGGKFFLQHRQTGEPMDIERGLADGGFGEFLSGTLEGDLTERVAKDRVRAVEEIGSHGILGGEVFAHANGLGALAGENECGFFHKWMEGCGDQCQRLCTMV